MNDQSLNKFLISVVNVRGLEEGSEESLPRRTPASEDKAEDAQKMSGFDALEFKYSVPFPLSLVISSKTVVRYQILFRYLLTMRHLETLLISCWEDHNKVLSWSQKSKDRNLEMWKRRAWTLRARMLNFVQQFTYYCTAEVIEPNWQNLMEVHVDFLDTCLKECMLMNSKLLKVVTTSLTLLLLSHIGQIHDKLVTCCTWFAAHTASFSRTLCTADQEFAGTPPALAYLKTLYPSSRHPIPENLKAFDGDALKKINENLIKYEDNFNRHIKILLDALDYYAATDTVALSLLCAQLTLASEKGGEDRLA